MNLQLPAYGSYEHMFPGLGYIKIKMVYDKKKEVVRKNQKQTNKKTGCGDQGRRTSETGT